MKNILVLLFLLLGVLLSKAQTFVEKEDGVISFITSQNVYVKFSSTQNVNDGDTLFIVNGYDKIPVLVVSNHSSVSCVCKPISNQNLSVSQPITAFFKPPTSIQEANKTQTKNEIFQSPLIDSIKAEPLKSVERTQNVSGRISISSYSNISTSNDFSQRMRYNFSLDAKNINGSKLSTETYISFVHNAENWNDIKSNIFNGLKIYSLAANYEFNKNSTIWIGRKINPHLSNAGAIDGLQYENKIKSFTSGVFVGTRPDYLSYGFNKKLLQSGAYLGHEFVSNSRTMQNSIAFIEQRNSGNVDRRFVYFQHSNSLLSKIYLFCSFEVDLFNKKLSIQDSSMVRDRKLNFTNSYFSMRYKISNKVSISASYSSRQNIIYYETYKNILEQLLETATMKGYSLQVNYRVLQYASVGANAGYRQTKNDSKPSKNVYLYATHTNIPWIKSSATLSATLLETVYLSGKIYSFGLSRDLIPSKLYGGISYRYVNYSFQSAETTLKQNMAELNVTWRPIKKIAVSLNLEGTFEKNINYQRIYVNITKRF